MREVAGASEVHGDTGCFSGSNNFFIADEAVLEVDIVEMLPD